MATSSCGQPGGEAHDCLVDLAGDLGGRRSAAPASSAQQRCFAEHAPAMAALGHAVGPERDEIAEAQHAFALVVFAVGDHAEQGAADADLLGLSLGGAHDHGRRVARAGCRQQIAALGRSQRGERGRAELARLALSADRVVDDRQDAAPATARSG